MTRLGPACEDGGVVSRSTLALRKEGEYVVYAQVRDAGGLDLITVSSEADIPITSVDNLSVARVELWVRHRSSALDPCSTWTLEDVGLAPTVRYVFAHGDGTYEFYTIGVDDSGNAEDPPAQADTRTQVLLSGSP